MWLSEEPQYAWSTISRKFCQIRFLNLARTRTHVICALREPWDLRVGSTWTVIWLMPPAPQCATSYFTDHSAPGTAPRTARPSSTTQDATPDERADPPRPLRPLFWVPICLQRGSPCSPGCVTKADPNNSSQVHSSRLQEQPDQDERPLVAAPIPPRKSGMVAPRLGAHCSSWGRGGAHWH